MSSQQIRAGRAFVELFADKDQLVRDLRVAENAVRKFGTGVAGLGAKLMGIGGLAAAALAPATLVFAGFQQEMSAVRAVTGATGESFDQLQKKARELGASTAFSAREAAEGMKFLGMAGFDTEQILAGIPGVLNLAQAGAVDLGTAADIASDVSGAFGLAAGEIGRVSDVMAQAAGAANVTITGLGESMKFAAPAGAAASQSIEEVTSALAVMGSQGLKGGIAGRNLAIIFKQLSRTDVQEKLRAIGVRVADAGGNFRDLHDIVRDLRPALDNMGGVERTRFLVQAFGEASKAAQILASQADGFSDMRTRLDQAAGSAQRMSAVMRENLLGDFQAARSAVEETAIALITALEPAFRAILQTATEAVRRIAAFIDQHPSLVLAVTGTAAAIGGLGTALVAIGTVTLLAGSALSGLRASLGWLLKELPATSRQMLATATATETLAAAATHAKTATAGSSFFAATAGMAAPKPDPNWGRVAHDPQALQAASAAAGTAAAKTSLWGAALGKVKLLLTSLGNVAKVAFSGSTLAMTAATVVATTLAVVIGGGLVKAISEKAGPTLRELAATLGATFGVAASAISSVVSAIGTGLVSAINGAAQAWGAFLDTLNVGGVPGWLAKQLDFGIAREQDRGRDLDARLEESRRKLGITSAKQPLDSAQLQQFADQVAQETMTAEERFDAHMERLNQALEAGTIDPEQFQRSKTLMEQQIRPAADAATRSAADIAQALTDFASRVRQEIRTPEEEFAQRMQQLRQALAADALNDDEFERAAQAARDELEAPLLQFAEGVRQALETPREAFQRYLEQLADAVLAGALLPDEADAAADAARAELDRREAQEQQTRDREAEAPIRDRLQADLGIHRAAGNLLGEIKALKDAAAQARQQGLTSLESELQQQQAETLFSGARRLEEQVGRNRDQASLTTVSAREAAFGLAQNTIDDQLLEEQKTVSAAARLTAQRLGVLVDLFQD